MGAALEILKKESANNHNYFSYLGNATIYPGRMSQFYSSFSTKFPKKLMSLVRLADPNVVLNSKLQYDEEWVENALDSLMVQISKINSIDGLANLFYDGATPGAALANELTTLTKNREFSFDGNEKLVKFLMRSYLEVFSSTFKFLQVNEIEKVYIFNGRFLHERATWDAAKVSSINAELFETTRNRYHLREKGFHDRVNNQNEMKKFWDSSPLPLDSKIEIGSRYFDLLRGSSNPFVNVQEFDSKEFSPYFVYFSNSDDEAVGFWESWSEKLGSQIHVVETLQKFFDGWNGTKLIVRLHPNLVNKSDSQKLEWSKIADTRNSLVIPAESEISSYKLLDGALGVMSFGSTLGLEAAHANKPSLLLADSGYDLLGVCDVARDWEYVYEWLTTDFNKSQSELTRRRINSCIRGFYLECGGNEFMNSKLRETGWGSWEVQMFMDLEFSSSKLEILLRKLIFKIRFKRFHRKTRTWQ